MIYQMLTRSRWIMKTRRTTARWLSLAGNDSWRHAMQHDNVGTYAWSESKVTDRVVIASILDKVVKVWRQSETCRCYWSLIYAHQLVISYIRNAPCHQRQWMSVCVNKIMAGPGTSLNPRNTYYESLGAGPVTECVHSNTFGISATTATTWAYGKLFA